MPKPLEAECRNVSKETDDAPSTAPEQDDGRVVELRADLFSPRFAGMALVHCVSADLAMGKGIAKTFKERFGGVDELRRQSLAVGQVPLRRRSPPQPSRAASSLPRPPAPADAGARTIAPSRPRGRWASCTCGSPRRAH